MEEALQWNYWLRLFFILVLKFGCGDHIVSLHYFYHTALAAQHFLHWIQWDLEGTVALLTEESIPRTCFVYSVPKLFLQPAVKRLASVCIRMIQKKCLKGSLERMNLRRCCFYSASLFCSWLSVSLLVCYVVEVSVCITPRALVQIIGQSCLLHNKKTKESNDLLVALPQIHFIIMVIGNVLVL